MKFDAHSAEARDYTHLQPKSVNRPDSNRQ